MDKRSPINSSSGNPSKLVQTIRHLATNPENVTQCGKNFIILTDTLSGNSLTNFWPERNQAKVVYGKRKRNEDQTVIATKARLEQRVMLRNRVLILKNLLLRCSLVGCHEIFVAYVAHIKVFSIYQIGLKLHFLMILIEGGASSKSLMSIMPDALILAKALLEEYSS
ncbi:hypothetical protein Tco_0317975 [Tanacetum coccineum]